MLIITTKTFDKKVKKLTGKIKVQAKERIDLFLTDRFSPVLNNHQLHGDKKLFRSININADLRLIYEEVNENTVRFLDIDTHSNLY